MPRTWNTVEGSPMASSVLLVLCLIVAVGLSEYVPVSEPKLKLPSGMDAESLWTMVKDFYAKFQSKLSSGMDAELRRTMVKDFRAKFQSLSQNFPSQSEKFWGVVRVACESVLRETHPSHPAVVMLAGHEEHSRTTECIARHITKVFTGVYAGAAEPQMLSPDDYVQYCDAKNLKKYIYNAVHATFDGGSRAIHVSEIHRVPGKAAVMFHAFCDNDNAPHKDRCVDYIHSSYRYTHCKRIRS